jgi:hypothetical protein
VPEKEETFLMQRKAEEAAGIDALAEVVKLQERRKMTPQWLRFVLRAVVAMAGERKDLLQTIVERRELRTKEHKGKSNAEVLLEAVAEFDEERSAGLLSEIAAAMDGLHPGENTDHALAIACRFYKVDHEELVAAHLRELKADAKKRAKVGKTESEAKAEDSPAPKASRKKQSSEKKAGVCSCCGCTDSEPCSMANEEQCVWADKDATFCSACADIQGRAREILEEGNKSPTLEEIANMLRDRLDETHPATREQIRTIVDHAVHRGVLISDPSTGRLRLKSAARIVEKAPTEGATPSMEITLKERIVGHLRSTPEKRATRQQLLKQFKGVAPSEVLRAIAELNADKLVKNASPSEPVELVAPSREEVIEQIEGLKLPELKARYSVVFNVSAPSGLTAVELRKRIVMKLSGESMDTLTAPKRNG